MHIRQQIREAVGMLVTGLPTTGGRVFKHPYALGPEETPALKVFTAAERSEAVGYGGDSGDQVVLSREVDLIVEAWAYGGDELDDTLDTIAEEVERVIAADTALGGVATDTTLARTEKSIDTQGDRRGGRLALTFVVRAMTPADDPSEAL